MSVKLLVRAALGCFFFASTILAHAADVSKPGASKPIGSLNPKTGKIVGLQLDSASGQYAAGEPIKVTILGEGSCKNEPGKPHAVLALLSSASQGVDIFNGFPRVIQLDPASYFYPKNMGKHVLTIRAHPDGVCAGEASVTLTVKPSILSITTDKPAYKIGEAIKVTVSGVPGTCPSVVGTKHPMLAKLGQVTLGVGNESGFPTHLYLTPEHPMYPKQLGTTILALAGQRPDCQGQLELPLQLLPPATLSPGAPIGK